MFFYIGMTSNFETPCRFIHSEWLHTGCTTCDYIKLGYPVGLYIVNDGIYVTTSKFSCNWDWYLWRKLRFLFIAEIGGVFNHNRLTLHSLNYENEGKPIWYSVGIHVGCGEKKEKPLKKGTSCIGTRPANMIERQIFFWHNHNQTSLTMH